MAIKWVVGTPASPKLGSLTKAALIPLCSMGQWDESFVSPNDLADVRVELAYNKVKKLLNSKDYPAHSASQDIAFLLEEIRNGARHYYSDHPAFEKAYRKHPDLLDDTKQVGVQLKVADVHRKALQDQLDASEEVGKYGGDTILLHFTAQEVEEKLRKAHRRVEELKISSMTEVARLHVENSRSQRDHLTKGLKVCQLDIEDMSSHYFTDLWQAVFWKEKDTCALGGKPIKNRPPFPLSDNWMSQRIEFLRERSEAKSPEVMEREARDRKRMAKELVNPPWRILSQGMARMRALHIERANKVLRSYEENSTLYSYLQAMVEFDAAVLMYVPLSPEAEDLFLGVEEGCSLMHKIQELQSNEEKKLQLYSQMSDREVQDMLKVHFVTVAQRHDQYKLATVDRSKIDAELCENLAHQTESSPTILYFLDPRYVTPEYFDYAHVEAGQCMTGPLDRYDTPLEVMDDVPLKCRALFDERLRGRLQEEVQPLDHTHELRLDPYAVNAERCIICVESTLGLTWSEPKKKEHLGFDLKGSGKEEKLCLDRKYQYVSSPSRERIVQRELALMQKAPAAPATSFRLIN